jgi:hypothetical protein
MDWVAGMLDRMRESQHADRQVLLKVLEHQEKIIDLLSNMEHTHKSRLSGLASAASGLIGKAIAVLALLALQVPLKDIVLAVMP